MQAINFPYRRMIFLYDTEKMPMYNLIEVLYNNFCKCLQNKKGVLDYVKNSIDYLRRRNVIFSYR